MIVKDSSNESVSYSPNSLSDGEKVVLYYISHVLQAPESGFIIVDEPEMYLHKTVVSQLWSILEQERPDCRFIYLSHDLDFVTSRVDAKKVWVKSFLYPDQWDIESIEENTLPEALFLEILGSRRPILFCEGKKESSIDTELYSILLPAFTIKPVGGCSQVINYTRTLNQISGFQYKAYGLIDFDTQTEERVSKLEGDGVFSLRVAEVENLLLHPDFLKSIAKHFCSSDNSVPTISKKALEELDKNVDAQASKYVTAKINFYFNDSHISEGKTLERVKSGFSSFTQPIMENINSWFDERSNLLRSIVVSQDYNELIKFYNKKGLLSIVEKELGIYDYKSKAIRFLKNNADAQEILKSLLPRGLIDAHQQAVADESK